MTPEEFWDNDIRHHILTFARSRRVSPLATLAVVAARGVATVPPTVTLPPTIGGRQSLNLSVALVGPSGQGKGACESAGIDAVQFESYDSEVPIVPIGSGEGIARTFRPAGTKPEEDNPVTTAIFSASEIDTFTAISSRQGSTTSGELRKVYSGESIGFANAGTATRNIVKAHSYRAVFLVGVQPLRSGPLLDAADGGTPQRFWWAPCDDPDAPDIAPPTPDPLILKVPSWAAGNMVIPGQALDAIVASRLSILRNDPDVDPLDGHKLLCRLKIAAALAVLESSGEITSSDWEAAGFLMTVSAGTRDRCHHALRAKSRRQNTAKALDAAEHDEIVGDRKLTRCKEGIVRWLNKADDGQLARNELRKKIKADLRDYIDPAIAELVDQRDVEEVSLDRGTAYRAVHGTPQVHPTLPAQTQGVPTVSRVPESDRNTRAMHLVNKLNQSATEEPA